MTTNLHRLSTPDLARLSGSQWVPAYRWDADLREASRKVPGATHAVFRGGRLEFFTSTDVCRAHLTLVYLTGRA
jgi:hypothetical protein